MPSAYSSMRSSASGVVGRWPRSEQLHDGQPGARGQAAQDRRLEGHQGDPRPRVVEAVAGQVAQQRHVERQAQAASWWAACLSSSITPTGRPRRTDSARTIASTSSSVATPSAPSYAVLAGRVAGIRSRAVRVRSSRER